MAYDPASQADGTGIVRFIIAVVFFTVVGFVMGHFFAYRYYDVSTLQQGSQEMEEIESRLEKAQTEIRRIKETSASLQKMLTDLNKSTNTVEDELRGFKIPRRKSKYAPAASSKKVTPGPATPTFPGKGT